MSLVVMSSAAVILPLSLCSGPQIAGSLRDTLPATQRCSAFQRPKRLLWRGCVLQASQSSDMGGYQQEGLLVQDCKVLWIVQHLRALQEHHFHCRILAGVCLALPQDHLGTPEIWLSHILGLRTNTIFIAIATYCWGPPCSALGPPEHNNEGFNRRMLSFSLLAISCQGLILATKCTIVLLGLPQDLSMIRLHITPAACLLAESGGTPQLDCLSVQKFVAVSTSFSNSFGLC